MCGSKPTKSRRYNIYILIIVDDYSRYTWIHFLTSKDEVFVEFVAWLIATENLSNTSLVSIWTDHGTEFENSQFLSFALKEA